MQPTAEHAANRTEHIPPDKLTIAAIAIAVYVAGNVLHEGFGHGGACLAVGGRWVLISTVEMECSVDSRLVLAAGTLANAAAGALFFALGRLIGPTSPRWKYFCWLAMCVNLFAAAGYFLFSGIGGFGDWAMFSRGLGPQWAWRVGMTVAGAGAYMLAARFSLLEMRPLVGRRQESRYARAAELTRLPYFTGGILACVAGSLNPQGWILVALSAAASTFGGTSGLLWMSNWFRGRGIPPGSAPEAMPVGRSWPWIAAACILAALFVGVLGPGVRFGAH